MESRLQPGSRRSKILIIDDEEQILKLLSHILMSHQYLVTTCEDSSKAFEILGSDNFDLVITDALMPKVSGYDFVKKMRSHPSFENLPVLMVTKKRGKEDVQRAVHSGVTDYIVKPIDEQILLDKVARTLNLSKRAQIYEHNLAEEHSQATLNVGVQLVSLSETLLTLVAPVPILKTMEVNLQVPLFKGIGVETPIFKFLRCREVPGSKESLYECDFSLIGMSETDLRKIRAWLQREEIRRKK